MTNRTDHASHSLQEIAEAIGRAIAPRGDAKSARLADIWQGELVRAFNDGALRLVRCDTLLPVHPSGRGALVAALTTAVIPLPEANRWLSKMGTGIALSERHFASIPIHRRRSAYDPETKEGARRMAHEFANAEFLRTGKIPSIEAVAAGIRPLLSRQFGKTWSVPTITRHCLESWEFRVISRTAQKPQEEI